MNDRTGAGGYTGSGKKWKVIDLLRSRKEWGILLAGALMAACFVLVIGYVWFKSTEWGGRLTTLIVTRIAIGRPGGVYFGHVLEFGPVTNVTVNFLVDAVAVCWIYPMFVFTVESVYVTRALDRFLRRIHDSARMNYANIKKYGVPGLFFFVLFPLWGTGPVVGSVIGYIMGLPPWTNMGIVLGATLLAVVLWTFLLVEVHTQVLAYGAFIPVLVILVVLAAGGITRWWPRRCNKS